MISCQVNLQWYWILLYAALIVPFSPFIVNPRLFYRGGLEDNATSVKAMLLLAASASISWVFAKSILNASTLGAKYGITGGIAYAGYYTSFASVAIVVYFMRTRHGYRSLPEAINERYGSLATVAFGLAVLFRLFQEVWSNALVVAGFYGPVHSTAWWLAACLSTLVPVIYAFSGGMRASIVTDVMQAVACIGFLIAACIVLGINAPASFGTWNPAGTCSLPGATTLSYNQCAADGGVSVGPDGTLGSLTKAQFKYTPASCNYATITNQTLCTQVGGTYKPSTCALTSQPVCAKSQGMWKPRDRWSLAGGMDLFIVALLQGLLSYPFFDPVLTDRAFLAHPRTMLWAFMLGGAVAAAFILVFSFLGIFGSMEAILNPAGVPASIYPGMLGGQPSDVSRYFGTAFFSIVNLIFITESLSTLDSTFTSAAKLMGPEFLGIVEDGKPRPPQTTTHRQLFLGRAVILGLAVLGILPLLSNPAALDATTVSGTIVMGLGPPVYALIWVKGYRPLTFHLPFWWGVAMGIVLQLSTSNCCKNYINTKGFAFGSGSYNTLLGFNVIGAAVGWGLMFLTLLENASGSEMKTKVGEGNNVVRAMQGVVGVLLCWLPKRTGVDDLPESSVGSEVDEKWAVHQNALGGDAADAAARTVEPKPAVAVPTSGQDNV
ncbi:hypothetical protein WJX72_003371 [[Myrmecia] bisecta]|uniref:Uncharacterized protein n=1 Tax=[Myrmecia] bisecta TaxID=41462 RepID=A0AAW1R6S4_9CHLO